MGVLTPFTRRKRICWVPADWGNLVGSLSKNYVVFERSERSDTTQTLDISALQSHMDSEWPLVVDLEL